MADVLSPKTEARIVRQLDGCWIWTGSVNNGGYGPHRRIYRLLVGPIAPGLDLDHLCRVRRCVNPAHLEPVTRRENLRRSVLTPTGRQFCTCGQPFTAEWGGRRYCRHCHSKNANKARNMRRKAAGRARVQP